MNSLDIEVIRTALAWQERGHRVVMGTVVRTWGSAPRPPGSLMIIRDDGQISGSVSGGCIDDDLIRRMARHEIASSQPEVITYGPLADETRRIDLPCGSTVQIVLEPLSSRSQLQKLLTAIESRRRVLRRLDLTTGFVQLEETTQSDRVTFDGQTLSTVHGPRFRLLIIGGGQLSRYLASMATMLDYQVTVCEPRSEYHEGWDLIGGTMLSTTMPDDLVRSMKMDQHSAVVAATHDPKLDDLALLEALRTRAFYVGALGSRQNNAKRRERLRRFELTVEEVSRLHGPIGLNLGARTPPEIAVSILAEMTAIRRGMDVTGPLNNWSDNAVCQQCRKP